MRENLGNILENERDRQELGLAAPHPDGGIVYVRRPTMNEFETLDDLTRQEISPSVACLELVRSVYIRNRDSFWGIYRATDESRRDARLVGYFGFLLLNESGHAALQARTLNARNPDLALLAEHGERPAAIYIWAVVAKRLTGIATPLVARAMGGALYGGLPLYATAGTLGGLNRLKNYGFEGGADNDVGLGDLFRLDRPASADDNPRAAA